MGEPNLSTSTLSILPIVQFGHEGTRDEHERLLYRANRSWNCSDQYVPLKAAIPIMGALKRVADASVAVCNLFPDKEPPPEVSALFARLKEAGYWPAEQAPAAPQPQETEKEKEAE